MSSADDAMKAHNEMMQSLPRSLPAPKANQKVPIEGTIRVSSITEEIIQDFEQAWTRLSLAGSCKDREEGEFAYSILCQRRRELYEHLADLEEIAGRTRNVIKRF